MSAGSGTVGPSGGSDPNAGSALTRGRVGPSSHVVMGASLPLSCGPRSGRAFGASVPLDRWAEATPDPSSRATSLAHVIDPTAVPDQTLGADPFSWLFCWGLARAEDLAVRTALIHTFDRNGHSNVSAGSAPSLSCVGAPAFSKTRCTWPFASSRYVALPGPTIPLPTPTGWEGSHARIPGPTRTAYATPGRRMAARTAPGQRRLARRIPTLTMSPDRGKARTTTAAMVTPAAIARV